MLYTEIAQAIVSHIQDTALWQLNDPNAQELVSLVEQPNSPFAGDFTIRLERVVKSIALLGGETEGDHFRQGMSEALHGGALAKLRKCVTNALTGRRQVLLLVDNLDKPWTKSADLDQLAEFLIGLLGAASRVTEELNQKAQGKHSVRVNSAIFVRGDIFERITAVAREPDKLSYTRLLWEDKELLWRVVEERYAASHGVTSDPSQMWQRYFCDTVKGVETKIYLAQQILPRPRDIVFFVKAAVSFAVNRKHERVEERDVLDGEKQYSQYALDSILVENGITIPELESVLVEFVGSETIVSGDEAAAKIVAAGISSEKSGSVVKHLIKLTFLGVEVSKDRFVFVEEGNQLRKATVLADRYTTVNGRRYEINRPFRAYLEIADPQPALAAV